MLNQSSYFFVIPLCIPPAGTCLQWDISLGNEILAMGGGGSNETGTQL